MTPEPTPDFRATASADRQSAAVPPIDELLRRCCARRGGCADSSGHACDAPEPMMLPCVETPGALEPRGPLSAAVQEVLTGLTKRPIERACRVSLLVNGAASYSAMLDLMRSARHELLLENFIFRSDAVGNAFAAELRECGARGARVLVLHDPFGSVMSRRLPIGFRFHRSPVAVRSYNPPRPTRAYFRWGRDHRKTLVQDGARCVVGGLCLADVWLGNCISHCTWRDSALLVEGSPAATVASEFQRMWERGWSFTPSRPIEALPSSATSPGGEIPVRIVADVRGARTVESVLVKVFDAAEREIFVTNPYFLPTAPVADALWSAAARGIDVRLLIPENTKNGLVGLATEHELGRDSSSGPKVWQWPGPLIHAKTVVVDRVWSLIGSSNLDTLSLRRNSELNVEVHGSTLGEQMAAVFEADCALSRRLAHEAGKKSPSRRFMGTVASSLRAFL